LERAEEGSFVLRFLSALAAARRGQTAGDRPSSVSRAPRARPRAPTLSGPRTHRAGGGSTDSAFRSIVGPPPHGRRRPGRPQFSHGASASDPQPPSLPAGGGQPAAAGAPRSAVGAPASRPRAAPRRAASIGWRA